MLAVSTRVLGHAHPGTVAHTRQLASTYRDQGRHAEAEALAVVPKQSPQP